MGVDFAFLNSLVSHENHQVTRVNEVRSSTIDADFSRAAWCLDCVGLEPYAIGHIEDADLLPLDDASRIQKVLID